MITISCKPCGKTFIPKPKGYNARYCSDTCKRRSQRARLRIENPEQLRSARKRSYQQTKKYPERLEGHRSTARKYRQYGREWLASYKLEHGCVDCGYRAHAAALQLDHEGKKSVEIAEARSSIGRLEAEIKAGDCKVRCANCHAIRTWERKQQARMAKGFTAPHDGGQIGKGCE